MGKKTGIVITMSERKNQNKKTDGSESMNATPSGERLQIGIFGKVNAGKSSL